MEQCSPYDGLFYYDEEEEGMVDLRSFLVQTRELEAAILSAHEEIARKEDEILHIRDLLMVALKERDEAHLASHKLSLENLSLQQQLHEQQMKANNNTTTTTTAIATATATNEKKNPTCTKFVAISCGDHLTHNVTTTTTNSFSSTTDNEDSSIVSEPVKSQSLPTSMQQQQLIVTALGKQRPLPSKGKLLQAVMEAGPLLQTLMLAGPLPQWQHPPPQLDSIEIPPVTIPSSPSLSPSSSLSISPSPSPSPSPDLKRKKPDGFVLMHQDSFTSTGTIGSLVNASNNNNSTKMGIL